MDNEELLKGYANQTAKYFELNDGEEKTVHYMGCELIDNKFDKTGKSKCVRYRFFVDGFEQYWDRGSRSLAIQMAKVMVNSVISIKRIGSGNQSKYEVRVVK